MTVSYETARRSVLKFGPMFAQEFRGSRPRADAVRCSPCFTRAVFGHRARESAVHEEAAGNKVWGEMKL